MSTEGAVVEAIADQAANVRLPVIFERRGVSTLEAAGARALDIVLAAMGLLLAIPLLVAIAIAIRLDSPGPALFKQVRVGRGGRHFTMWKFRGMYEDARERHPEMYAYNYTPEEIPSLRFHPDKDPRITKVGAFIRRTSLDELPNLVNVITGDMSLVGPRPEIPEMMQYYGEATDLLLSVKPGVTSLPKVTGRDQLTFTKTLALDLEYVRSQSLMLNMKIIGRTIRTLLTDGWAH